MRTNPALRRSVTIAGAATALIILGATAAWAPKTLNLPVVDGPCKSGSQTGYLLGQFTPTQFLAAGRTLTTRGEMDATCDLARNDVTIVGAASRVEAGVLTSDCRLLVVELNRGRTQGVSYDLEGDLMIFESDEGEDDQLLCRIARLKDDPRKLIPLLNELLEATA
jgi:hypothetical protein